MIYVLWDTPARRAEMASMSIDGLDMDSGLILVKGKGRKQRWMPLPAQEFQGLAAVHHVHDQPPSIGLMAWFLGLLTSYRRRVRRPEPENRLRAVWIGGL